MYKIRVRVTGVRETDLVKILKVLEDCPEGYSATLSWELETTCPCVLEKICIGSYQANPRAKVEVVESLKLGSLVDFLDAKVHWKTCGDPTTP